MRSSAADRFALAALIAAAVYYVSVLTGAAHAPKAVRAFDIYSFFYPVMILTARAVWNGGSGLFWNPFQNCGQPMFGGGTTGILYPPNLSSLVLPPDLALYLVLFFNLAVAGVSAYYLCRQLGTSVPAALCGGLSFAFGTASIDNLTFTPLVSGPYAWLPAGMLFCERILSAPTLRRSAALGAVIAVALMPGHPQAVFYLYQLIAVRYGWELITRRDFPRLRTACMLGLGLALGPLFAAVQLVPYVEVMLGSIRNAALNLRELRPGGYVSWAIIRRQVTMRSDIYNPFVLLPYVLASAALLDSRRRRYVGFYLLVGLACLDLGLGPNGHLFHLYIHLPFGALFRDPARFFWITLFCLAPLAAIGVDAIVTRGDRDTFVRRIGLIALLLAVAVAFSRIPTRGLHLWEWTLVLTVGTAAFVAWGIPRSRTLVAIAIAVTVFLNLVAWRPVPFRRLLPRGDVLFSRADVYEPLRARMTAQDRTYLEVPEREFSLQQKTGSLFGVPAIFDYEAQPTRRYAGLFSMLRTGAPLRGLNDWLYPIGGFLLPGLKPRLLDITAARYLIVGTELDRTAALRLPVREVFALPDLRIYENMNALPRAFYVPRIEVVADPAALLQRLATGNDDLRRVVFVEEEFPSGFRGDSVEAASRVEFARNDPEHLQLRVHAPQRGFVFLADQYFAGWRATVNGESTPIRRANYVFRLIEVPAGDSIVEFRYRPLSVALGAAISLATFAGVGVTLFRARQRGEGPSPAPGTASG